MKKILIEILVLILVVAGVEAVNVMGEQTWSEQTWHFTNEDVGTADIPNHVVISEIMINGPDGEEFVELYNPTNSDITMTGWHWCYFSPGRNWNESWRDKVFPSGTIIAAHSFYLIATTLGEFPTADWNLEYASHFLSDTAGSVGIFPWDPDTKTAEEAKAGRIDAVAWGSVSYVKEGTEASVPSKGKSIERKAGSGSTSEKMASGGYHYSWGNGQDTDDNSQDFLIKDDPEAQNSQSPIEVYPTKASDSPATHAIDGVMSKTAPGGTTVLKDISGGADGTVLWWYPEYPAQCDVSFGEYPWTAHVCYDNTDGGVDGTLSAEVFKVASADGATTRLAYNTTTSISAGASGSVDITCTDDTATTQTIPKGDRFGVRISWDKSTAITIKFNSTSCDSYLASPPTDPGYPIPEFSTILIPILGTITLFAIFRKISASEKK